MTDITVSVPLAKLVPSQINVRKTYNAAGIEALAANIAVHKGLLQNLVVRPIEGGKYEVVAGGRRHAALKLLVKAKKLPKSYMVPVQVRDGDDALAASLAENVIREPMHPADEFAAFAGLIGQGMSTEDVAASFGVTPGVVTRRMKLAAVAPFILDAFRKGELTLQQVMGFTVSEDHAEQERVFQEVSTWHYAARREQIVQLLTHEQMQVSDYRFQFVGEAAYLEAGGAITRDLFSEQDAAYATDSGLVLRLAMDKLKALAPDYLAQGWKWIEAAANFDYGAAGGYGRIQTQRISLSAEDEAQRDALAEEYDTLTEGEGELTDEQAARLDAIEAEIDAINDKTAAYKPEEMALAGGWLTVSRSGAVDFMAGYVRKEDWPAVAALGKAAEDEGGNGGDTEPGDPTAELPAQTGPKLSEVLLADLHAARTTALRNEIAQRPDIALRTLAHGLAVREFGHSSAVLTVHPSVTYLNREQTAAIDESGWRNALDHWKDRLPGDPEALWHAIMDLADMDVQDLIATLVAPLVDATYAKAQYGHSAKPGQMAECLATTLNLDMRRHWTPTVETYFGRVNKAAITEAVTEATSEQDAQRLVGLKKGIMAEEAARLVAATDWLPQPIRTHRD